MINSAHLTRSTALVIGCMVLAALQPARSIVAQGGVPASLAGQTVTTLPDGRELILGGSTAGQIQAGVWLRDPRTGAALEITALRHARTSHTATLLPDGTVLVLGGVDGRGRPVQPVERLDLRAGTTTVIPGLRWQRSGHSATLLDANQLVVAGGITVKGLIADVDVIDLQQWTVTKLGELTSPRAHHSAALLANGTIEVWGGNSADLAGISSGAIIDAGSRTVREVFAREQDEALLSLAGSDPVDGASVEAAPRQITLRFSRPALLESVNIRTVTLAGPTGDLRIEVVPAEGGRLAFIRPIDPLEPNASYLVTVGGARDSRNNSFPLLSVSFTTTSAAASASESSNDDVWDPRVQDSAHTWRRKAVESKWQKLPPLKAKAGVTALSGQALRLDGSPLAGVRLELDDRSAVTDETGRFLLVNDSLQTGWHELWIDGRKAKARATFGTFEAAVWLTAGETAVLPYTIWMPAIDTAHAARIPSPTTTETIITTPLIPGLELRLPAGTVITDEDGKVVREVSITPIPVDQPPFPLPSTVDVPVYFTVQPGGAYVSVPGAGGYTRGARLIYPNYRMRPAGAPMEFWHYDPDAGRGWYVYGRGAVSADGKQVIPDRGVSIREFTGAMAAPPQLAADPSPSPADPGKDGDPVHLGTGLFIMNKTDLMLPDISPIAIRRTYRQKDTIVRAFGIGATHEYDLFLVGDVFPYTYLDLVLPDGGRVHYTRISSGTGYADAVYEHTSTPTGYLKSRISWNGAGWTLDLKDGGRIMFRDGFAATRPMHGAATRIQDRYGNAIVLTRDSSADLTRITSPSGRWIELTYDATHRVTQATDNIGRIVSYTYDASGRLWKVTDPANGVTEYTYDASHRMLTLKDARGIVFLTNEYDANGRVFRQTQADVTTFQFAYTLDAMGRVTQTDVTDPRGIVRRVAYNAASGYLTSDTAAFGTSLARTTTFTRDSTTNNVTRMTDGLGRHTDYTYDSSGNVTSVTRLASTANAVTTSYTYDATFNQITSVTDPLNHTTTLTRDSLGNVTTIADPLSHQTTLTYTTAGQPMTVTTPAGTTTFTYDGGDLVAVSDPLGRTSTRFADGGGRIVRTTSPLGHATTHEYNALNRVTKTIDGLGGQTTFTYDANGNLLTLTDALNHTTTYTYNTMDRVATRTDPLTRVESYVYDNNGNLQQVTDRKNQVTTYAYDNLNRLSTVTYHDTSTTTHTYDAGDRLTQVVDSVGGTITRGYDLLDRLTSETTPEGSISYTYDAASRRATMTVAGQPQVSYAYDNANRLTSITQNTAVVGFTYDAADRRTVLTLPNGVTTEYGYDAASQVTSLTYKVGVTTLGDLTYTYDLVGNRTQVGGTWSRTGLPSALASATYDAGNQIATWGGTAFTYDANGNLTNDGSNTHVWNTRNQLASLSGGASASFLYDGFGRRRSKTVAGSSTAFLYDGLNAVQELVGGSPAANILPGLGIDEWLSRTDAGATRYFLTEVLGNTLALTDNSGAVQTQYTYESFGKASISGTSSANRFGFTGREDDGTGLMYYRARFYSPVLQRFVSEDPLGFAGGPNLHAYVQDAPTRFIDPFGLQVMNGGPVPVFGLPEGDDPPFCIPPGEYDPRPVDGIASPWGPHPDLIYKVPTTTGVEVLPNGEVVNFYPGAALNEIHFPSSGSEVPLLLFPVPALPGYGWLPKSDSTFNQPGDAKWQRWFKRIPQPAPVAPTPLPPPYGRESHPPKKCP